MYRRRSRKTQARSVKSKAPRMTKSDRLSEAVARDWAHANSAVINSRVRVLQFEAEEVDKSLAALQATVLQVRERRAAIEATLTGLGQVLARR
jgi:hypothetical protein